MANHQADYGIERGFEYQKTDIQALIGVKNIKTVRESLELAGLSTAQRSYTGEELLDSGFVQIRKLFDQGWTKKRILEEYLGVQSTSGGESPSKHEEESGDDLAVIERALEEGALEIGEVLAERTADYLVQRFPQLLIRDLGKRGGRGDIRAAFAKARQETQARQLSAAEINRQQEMLNNFDFPATPRVLKSAAPPAQEDEDLEVREDPWSESERDALEGESIYRSLEDDVAES